MSIKVYQVESWSPAPIVEHTPIRLTAQFVVFAERDYHGNILKDRDGKIKERRAAINNSYSRYFLSWEEARSYIVKKAALEVVSAKDRLKAAEDHLKEMEKIPMEKP